MFGFKRWAFARRVRAGAALLGLAVLTNVSGCGTTGAANEELLYPSGNDTANFYLEEETKIAHSNFVQQPPDDVLLTAPPRTINDRSDDLVRDLSLGEVIHIALMNNDIVQTGIQAPVGSKQIFTAGDNIPSIYDQAINETGVLFGRRGVEAALSDFDATWSSSMTWGRSRNPTNSLGNPMFMIPAGQTQIAETWNSSSRLRKQFATGGSVTLFNNWSYAGTNNDFVLFPSSFSGNSGVQVRQPLLAGSGVEFTRIAGPVNPNFGAITGVSQGVVIARINSDIALADFEAAVRNSMRDVQKAYWALYLNYRNYETAVIAHRSAYQTWKESKIKLDVGTLKAADEAQAREQFYATRANVERSLNALYQSETGLRRLMGLQLNDGEVIRPSDEPMVAAFVPDWQSSLAEALTRRVELRRQKWNIKSLQFQLRAANSLTQPQFDLVGSAQLNGFGDDLSGSGSNFGNAAATLLDRDYGAWSAGFEVSVPIGYRSATTQVRNYELRVAKARAVLAQMEREIAHDVSNAVQDVTANFTSAATNEERLIAARRRVELLELERVEGTTTLDLVLRAQSALAQAQGDYYARVIDFTNAMIDLEFAKGSLLASSGVQLAEGAWDCAAYHDAYRRAMERTNGVCNEHLQTYPEEFASIEPVYSPDITGLDIGVPETLLDGLPEHPEVLIEPGQPVDPGTPFDSLDSLDQKLPSGEAAPLPPGWEREPDSTEPLDLFEAEPKVPDLPDVAETLDDTFFFSGQWQPTVADPKPKASGSILQLSHSDSIGNQKKTVNTADFEYIEIEKDPRPNPESRDDWKHIPGPFKVPTGLRKLSARPLPARKNDVTPLRFDELFESRTEK